MNEGRENFDGQDKHEHVSSEVSYSVNVQEVDQGALRKFSPDAKTEYALTIGVGEFPLEGRLRGAHMPEAYAQLTADLAVFYTAQVETLEGKQPATVADVEAVALAQMMHERAQSVEKKGQPAEEIATAEDATEYLRQPGMMEGLSDKARRLLAIAFSATAFAAAAPAEAQQGWGPMIGQYVISRGVQETQMAVQARMQMEQMKSQCDLAIQSMENNLQFQLENLQMQQGLNLNGIVLLGTDAPRQFQTNNPHSTPQQIAAFTQARQTALQVNMQMRQVVTQCNMQMQQVVQGARYSRTMRILGDIPVLTR